jgi:hypothetical protein
MDMSDYPTWKAAAQRSGDAAYDIYEADTVEHELALHLLRALRELDKRDGTEDDAIFNEAMDGLVADGLFEVRETRHP